MNTIWQRARKCEACYINLSLGLLSTKRLIRFREAGCAFMPVACRAARGVVLAVLALCALAPQAFAADTTLQWDPNTEPDLAGYTMHYGSTVSRAYTTHLDVGKTVVISRSPVLLTVLRIISPSPPATPSGTKAAIRMRSS